ncbi:ATP-binding protein, partial [Limosilactobacillus reuteri]|uniref:ATP-binding protein n=1 Tax=Limosilactobacillus reuteri TaxID=1598 RepID=UPI00298D024C
KAAQGKQHLERVMRRYERYDLLIIDELGYLPISAEEAKLLFQRKQSITVRIEKIRGMSYRKVVIHVPVFIYGILFGLFLTMVNKPQVLRPCGLVSDQKDT